MTNHYEVLGLEVGATMVEVEAAFEQELANRRAKRQKTADVHVAQAVLSDEGLRRTYDVALRGAIAGERIAGAKNAFVEAVTDAIPDIKWSEVRANAAIATLQATVLVTGLTAKTSDTAGSIARRIQSAAAKRLSSY